jgi:hypothetical protein
MAAIGELIATYLTACEVEGKAENTVTVYRATLRDFRRVGERFGLPEEADSHAVTDATPTSRSSGSAGPRPATSTAATAR